MAANQTANFVVKAKDSASGPLGKIGTSMGKLRRVGFSAFKGIAAGAAVVIIRPLMQDQGGAGAVQQAKLAVI